MPEQWVWIQNLKILQVSRLCLIFKCVLVCCCHWVARKKRIDFCIEKQQKSIDWLIGDPLIINTCIAQHLMGNVVWQQHKQYHLRLHCAECWQLLQNPLLGKWGKSEGIWAFFLSVWLHSSHLHSFLHTSPLVWLQFRMTFTFQITYFAQWCYWWWSSFSLALTKHGFIKYVIASVLHWSMIFCSTTSWWKIQG